MALQDPRHDIYIAKALPFAQPILKHIRMLVRQTCPKVEETMKWSFPHFSYKGKILCSMAAFKQHASLGFWLGDAIRSLKPYQVLEGDDKAMGQLGKLTSVNDLPKDKALTDIIKEAMTLIDEGFILKKAPTSLRAALPVPDYFAKALSGNKKARMNFEKFPPSHRKEYIQWITGAKTAATREKRMATALEWIAEGKGRHWKYEQKK
ncbi:YdeI/OmpD-associated family protein [Niabella aurantiaca]|uniref:YdeI/OmpD-associated family protein n=1 Tax=Niabella aurantiaca TaxID=379900 RepID=UPI00035DA5D8|nr:YdeI/OmpD-associated family protein [Niabella aurantiaca]